MATVKSKEPMKQSKPLLSVLNSDSKLITSIDQPPCGEYSSQGAFFIDAHCHLADKRLDWQQELADAGETGIGGVISCALSPDEIAWHQQHVHSAVRWVAGMHPWYEPGRELTLDAVAALCQQRSICGIGEIGLDGRGGEQAQQQRMLLAQLDLARMYNLPVVLHVVRQHYALVKLLKNNFPSVFGLVHGFSTSLEVAQAYSQFSLGLSIGCRMPGTKALQHILQRGLYTVETDAPFQKSHDSEGDLNHVANCCVPIARLSNLSPGGEDQVRRQQWQTLQQLGFMERK
jgi:TatD DNase family protein